MLRLAILTTILGAQFCAAQISIPGTGGTGPFPGGTRYPGGPGTGQGQGQGGPMGIPGTGGNSRSGRNAAPITITTTGLLRVITSEQLVLEADDHRVIRYDLNRKTVFTKDARPIEAKAFTIADHLTVSATKDEKGFFTALAVTFNLAGTAEERKDATRTTDLPVLKGAKASQDSPSQTSSSRNTQAEAEPKSATVVSGTEAAADDDDPGRPQLRRGVPVPKRSNPTVVSSIPSLPGSPASNGPGSTGPAVVPAGPSDGNDSKNQPTPAETTSVIAIQEDPLIEKAREAAAGYTASLPNFLVRQNTTRYESDNPKTGWNALDTTTADVTYEDGTQTYKNVKVGNRSVKSIGETGGSWSTGEFAGWMEDLLSSSTNAKFRQANSATIARRSAVAFKFDVPRERSNWRIDAPAQVYIPAYRGTVWIDRSTSRVLRIEVEARGIPPLFPFDKIETAIDYDFVRLAATQNFLLPTAAEVLSCQAGSTYCTRNRIEFRNYRKFGAESGVTFDQPDADPVH